MARVADIIRKARISPETRVNIQDRKGMAKSYQVRQVLKAIDTLKAQHD